MESYFAYFKIKFLNEIQYKVAAIAGIFTQIVWGAMYIMLYTVFLNNSSNQTMTISQMSTYIWLQQGLYMLFNIWSMDKDILEQIKDGSISMELLKPVRIISNLACKNIRKKSCTCNFKKYTFIYYLQYFATGNLWIFSSS